TCARRSWSYAWRRFRTWHFDACGGWLEWTSTGGSPPVPAKFSRRADELPFDSLQFPLSPPSFAAETATVAVIETRDLRKRFGRIEALRGVTLKVEPGEVFGLLGQNGAGKTTLIKILL